jgi:Chlorophyll A-B binding protein
MLTAEALDCTQLCCARIVFCLLQSEIKHGRVAMLASVGYLVQESFHPFFTENPQADIGPALIHFQVCTALRYLHHHLLTAAFASAAFNHH